MTIRRTKLATPRDRGFSMIDVLIAIVVLATGLLALAALQGAMTRSSSDARSRSQIAAYTQGLIDQLRAGGYDNIATATISPTSTTCPDSSSRAKEAYCAQTAAGVSNLSTAITSTTYYGSVGGVGGAFTTTAPANLGGVAQYKQVNVTTTWTDSLGQAGRQVSFDTTMSSTGLATTNTSLITQGFNGGLVTGPIVRETNPANTIGVIPIAISSSASSAATNPAPVVTNTGTTFSTFTYNTAASSYGGNVIQARVDTKVIQCSCAYKPTGVVTNDPNLGTIFAQPYRPTYWDGYHYVAPTATNVTVSTATTSLTGIVSTATQDTDCDICCRDRNDSNSDPAGTIKFDSFSGTTAHFQYVGGVPVALAGLSGTYVEACRMIRVNGTYATATDIHNYFFGLLATDNCANEIANSLTAAPTGCTSTADASDTVPSPTTESTYASFVKQYLYNSLTSFQAGTGPQDASQDPQTPSPGNDAAVLYNSTYALNSSNTTITLPNTVSRWVYARGLYVDHLETAAVTALTTAIITCGTSPTTAQLENCALPTLPFTTVNMTELANWSSSNTAVINVSDTAIIGGDESSPKRGNVTVPSTQTGSGTPSPTANAVATTYVTNSGLTGVTVDQANSTYDTGTSGGLTDQKQFTVTGGSSGSGGSVYFVAALTGLSWMSAISNSSLDPAVSWSGTAAQLGAAASGAANAYLTSSGSGSNKTYTAQYAGSSATVPVPISTSITPAGVTLNVQYFNSCAGQHKTSTGGTANCQTTTGAGSDSGTCTAISGGTAGTFSVNTATQCNNYAVNAAGIQINGTTISGATVTLMSGTADGGMAEGAAILIPSSPGISSTTNTTAGATSVTIPFTLTGTTVVPGTCVCTSSHCGSSHQTYTPGTCSY